MKLRFTEERPRILWQWLGAAVSVPVLLLGLTAQATANQSEGSAHANDREQRIAEELTRAYTAEYNLNRRGRTHGDASRVLQRTENNTWRYQTHTAGRILFLSDRRYNDTEFVLESGRVAPLNFEYTREGTGSNRYFYVTFDREGEQFVTENGDPVTAPYSADMLDPNAVLHQLQLDVAGTDDNWTYNLIDEDGELSVYEFERQQTETLDLPYGSVEAIKVSRVRDHDRRQTYFWFAPRINFTMVKMQQIEKGREQAAVVLTSLEFH